MSTYRVTFNLERRILADSETEAIERAEHEILNELLEQTHWDLEDLAEVKTVPEDIPDGR